MAYYFGSTAEKAKERGIDGTIDLEGRPACMFTIDDPMPSQILRIKQ
jgi:hypothetical protein